MKSTYQQAVLTKESFKLKLDGITCKNDKTKPTLDDDDD